MANFKFSLVYVVASVGVISGVSVVFVLFVWSFVVGIFGDVFVVAFAVAIFVVVLIGVFVVAFVGFFVGLSVGVFVDDTFGLILVVAGVRVVFISLLFFFTFLVLLLSVFLSFLSALLLAFVAEYFKHSV